MFGSVALYFIACSLFQVASAANADQWRTRSIYQVIVDRYALPDGADPNACDPGKQTWCGGTWNTIRANLDYIQNAGFTAIWISPVSQNYEGPRTPYGDPYHGYWISDATKLNSKFGTSDDLKALSDDLHSRGMYLMVDVVVNNVMALSTNPDLSTFLFKDQSQYHSYCPIDWGNTTSEQTCWLGDTNVTLPDVKTEDPTVVSTYSNWIQSLVQEYNIDGLRIDAAKHVDTAFWPVFCGKAGVFCIGEVFDADPSQAAVYQGPQALDSILHYPMYSALANAFTIPGPQNMSAVADMISQSKKLFKDPTLLGNFLENQDVPRWANLSVDPQSMFNAMVFNFMSDGIPIVYYGQEQGFHGNSDPFNREPLWPSNYAQTTAYNMIAKLNQFRNFLVNNTDWATQQMEVLTQTNEAIAFQKGNVVSIVTNVGSPPQNVSVPVYTKWKPAMTLTEILSCKQYAIGSNGTIEVQYSAGGRAAIFALSNDLVGSKICATDGATDPATPGTAVSSVTSDGIPRLILSSPTLLSFIVILLGLFTFRV